MKRVQRAAYRAFLGFCVALVVAVAFVPVPSIIGALYPVVGLAELHKAVQYPPPPHRHIWTASAVKRVGARCRFDGVDWYFGPVGGGVSVPAHFEDPPQTRARGVLHWDGLVIAMRPEDVTRNSHAYVDHLCKWGPVVVPVRTLFFSSEENR